MPATEAAAELPTVSYARSDQAVETPDFAVCAALLTAGPYVFASGAVRRASFRKTLSVAFQLRVSGTAAVSTVPAGAQREVRLRGERRSRGLGDDGPRRAGDGLAGLVNSLDLDLVGARGEGQLRGRRRTRGGGGRPAVDEDFVRRDEGRRGRRGPGHRERAVGVRGGADDARAGDRAESEAGDGTGREGADGGEGGVEGVAGAQGVVAVTVTVDRGECHLLTGPPAPAGEVLAADGGGEGVVRAGVDAVLAQLPGREAGDRGHRLGGGCGVHVGADDRDAGGLRVEAVRVRADNRESDAALAALVVRPALVDEEVVVVDRGRVMDDRRRDLPRYVRWLLRTQRLVRAPPRAGGDRRLGNHARRRSRRGRRGRLRR